ncbi:MAG: succinate dehydrogenase, cytochrome b556 subunit [Endozoicomonas sp.]
MALLILLCTPSGVGTKNVNSKRPVNLDITTIKLPLPAYTSILHRISGVLLFVGVGFLLYGLDLSLTSEQSFAELKEILSSGLAKFIVWVLLSGLIYHFVAGVKHLLMDIGLGEGKESGKAGAIVTIAVSAVLIVLAGVWVW